MPVSSRNRSVNRTKQLKKLLCRHPERSEGTGSKRTAAGRQQSRHSSLSAETDQLFFAAIAACAAASLAIGTRNGEQDT